MTYSAAKISLFTNDALFFCDLGAKFDRCSGMRAALWKVFL